MLNLKKFFTISVTLTLLLLSGIAKAQIVVAISNVTAETGAHFADKDDFSAGTLTVTFIMNTGYTTADVAIDLASGIEYIPNSVTVSGGGATVAQAAGHTAAAPRFTVTAASGSNVALAIKRKVTKAALGSLDNLKDTAVLTIGGVTSDPVFNNPPYDLKRPTLTVQLPETTHNDALGTHTKTFTIRNTGYGIVKDVYFSVNYPADVVGNSFWYAGTKLTPMVIGGKTVYKVPNVHLANNQAVTISENYTVKKCTAGRQIGYEAHWGTDTVIFETNTSAKNISVSTGIPIITHSSNSAFNYFKWQDGFCGNILGTYYVRFDNETADAKGTAYNVEVQLFDGDPTIGFSYFEPINIRLVATDGTEIPIAATGTGNTRFIKFSDLAAVSNASLGSRNVGFTDEDGDGFKDDLKKGAYFQIAFDLKKKQEFQCLQPGKTTKNYFSLQPRAYVLYDNVCTGGRDKSDLRLIDYGTMRIYFNGVNDASKLPAQLVQNVPSAGYIAPGMNWPSLGIHQRLKNEGTLSDNMRQFKYVVTTPAGLKLQNVKLYRRTNVFGASEVAPISIADIAPNTTVTITTSNTATYRDLTSGYLSFDALLDDCNGRSEVPITYSVYLMVKNGDGTYCDIPLVCGQTTNIPVVCAGICSIQAPTILSTIVERADNSYGWKDHTMTARRTRTEVSPIERMRALYLDDIEFITKGQQHAGKSIDNLFYWVKVEKTAELEPKKITLTVNGGTELTFNASATNPMRGTNAAGKKYFRWNLTSLLPAGTLPAGATFTAVATYQVKNNNPTNSNDRTMDIQSGIESFFYTLDNPTTDTAIHTEGYHTAEKHCGPSLTPIFYIAETQSMLATNEYKEFSGCNAVQLGSNLIYAARRFKPGGTYFSQEFRPARLTKKITIKMPSAYQITNIKYTYSYKIAEAAKEATVDMSKLTVVDDGTWKTYTYINPPKGTIGHLPPGMITVVNDYNEYIKVFIQPSCKAKTVDGNKSFWNQGLDAKAMNEIISSNIEYEDYYYHYAETANSLIATDYLNERPILFAESKKPDINIEAVSQLTVKATKNTEDAIIKIENIKDNDAPFGWVSIPDVTGLEVLSLTEITSAKAHVRTYTAQSSISGEKMFFLSEAGNDGKILKNSVRYFKINYKITNCNSPVLHLKVYAGWNCSSNPTTGYRNTCSDKSATFSITIAKSKKEIAADPSNPGYNDPNKVGSITMCDKTAYSYTINSADEGDIYDAKLVVTQAAGITFHEVEVEYPLGSGTKYQVGTGANKIHHSVNGNKHTFDISAILPNGSLPGSLSEPVNANNRQFKLTFKVQPDCNFSAGSSFDIDIEGNNLCGSPALGDKTRAIIAGITGVNVNKYSINLDPLTYVSGNGSLCGGGITYKTRVTIVSADPTFQVGNNARLRFTIPEGYELTSSYLHSLTKSPGVLWANPVRKQSEERTLASGSELVMDIPAGMKNAQFFELGINIVQKANAVIACDTPKNLKVFATDTVTGVTCATLTPPATTCPSLTVGTSLERTIQVKNERPELSFKDINTTSEIQGGKEKLTIKYKVVNAATASATLIARPVVASLYYDANNNGQVDSGDTKLTTYTSTETLGKGVTSPERTFDYQVEQDKICRLLLVLKNEDNVCLCGDVVTKVTAPTELSGLVSSLTTCATSSVTFEYNSQAPSYVGYEWKAVSPANALGFLNNTNTPTPTFTYNGATLTNTLTVTYTLVVKRTNGCEAQQTVTVLVKAVPKPTLTVSPTLVIDCSATNVDTAIDNWLQQAASATAGAPCATIATLTHNYNSVKPADLCAATVVTVTYTAIDNFGGTTTKTATITLVSIKANNETITVSHGAVATTTSASVLTNDLANTRTATTGTVSLTVVTPATGVAGSATPTLNNDGTITVPAGTKSGTYTIGYKICTKVASVTACDTATTTIVVGAAPIVATPDVVTVTAGSTSSGSVIDNDHIGTATTTTSTVSVTVVTPATPKGSGVATPTITDEGKVTVPNNTPAGTYTIVYRVCEKLNAGNCTTTTATVVVPVEPIVATPDVVTVTAGGTSSGSVIDNDHIGTATTTTSTVSVTVVTPATPKGSGVATPTITDEGKVTVPNNTPAGTYTIVYRVCEKLN
ncbi:gliding motility-associated C-terminal domain-containing protein, partial [Capnocytophaga bilenii]